ncbi:DUF4328 domain-containing protein [Streptomyces sp. NPDC053367]|uniref:DUF4328 domain-containing protein n=1 Tax=Streptomyces sp. NPDC053367 TaxID=3365700 RepID=UPI0037D0DB9F
MTVSESERPLPDAAPPRESPRPSRWLLRLVTAFLVAAAAGGAYAVYAGVRLYSVIEGDAGFLTVPQDEFQEAARRYENAGRVQGFAFALCAVVFLVWFSRMRRLTGQLAPDAFRRGPGWAVGAWFIPFASLWMPYRIAMDMWAAASPLPDGGKPTRAPVWPVNLWWGLFVANVTLGRYSAFRLDTAEDLFALRDAVRQYLLCDTLEVLAAGAAVYFAFRLTALQERKAAQGPFLSGV